MAKCTRFVGLRRRLAHQIQQSQIALVHNRRHGRPQEREPCRSLQGEPAANRQSFPHPLVSFQVI
jgi:hypothetical protein